MLGDDYFSNSDVRQFFRQDLAILEAQASPYLSDSRIPYDKRYNLISMIKNYFKTFSNKAP